MSERDTLHFCDRRGNYIVGHVMDDNSLLVLKSNIASPGDNLIKNPYWDWEQAATVVSGTTLLTPRSLMKLTRLFESNWREDEEYEETEVVS